MKNFTIALVDDENLHRITIADELKDAGFKVHEFSMATALLSTISEIEPNVVVTDLNMPEMDGLELLSRIKQYNSDISVILITAYASLQTALQAMKKGAYDYLSKPFDTEELIHIINRIRELEDVKNDNKRLRNQLFSSYDFSAFVGSSDTIKRVFELVRIVSKSDTTVSISGETGTGKELLTNIIHYNSNRKKQPLIKVNCAILSKDIFESELFGHEKGAFTNADAQKIGRFELADKGTIYLDDIDDMPLPLQVKLLRVLEEGEIERVGGTKTIKIDVRVIISTKVDLKTLVEEGRFREDLYYRLNVFPITIPPLRKRKNDIKDLFVHFTNQFSNNTNVSYDSEVINILKQYDFPGNTRELKNICERMVLLANGNRITPKEVPLEIKSPSPLRICSSIGEKPLPEMVSDFEISAITIAMEENSNNMTKAASVLGIPITTLRSKILKYELSF